jgi:hypothetical protein
MPAFEAGFPTAFKAAAIGKSRGIIRIETDRLRARVNASSSRLPVLTAAAGSSGFQVRWERANFEFVAARAAFRAAAPARSPKRRRAIRSSGPVGAAGVLGRFYPTAFKAVCLRRRRGSRFPTWRAGLQLSGLHLADGFQGRPLRLVQEARFPRLIALRLSWPVPSDGCRNRLPASRKRARENQVGCSRPSEPLPAVSSYLVSAEALSSACTEHLRAQHALRKSGG